MKCKTLFWRGTSDSSVEYPGSNMKASSPRLVEEQLEEVYSVQWNVASDMYWQFGDKKSALLVYLTEHGPREFPRFKKGLKQLKKTLKRLADGDPVPNTIKLTNENPSNLKAFIAEVASQVSVATVSLRQPGLRKFFTQGIGKHVLTALEKKHLCSIETLDEKPLVVSDDEAQSRVLKPPLCIPDFAKIIEDLDPEVDPPVIIDEEAPFADWKEMIWEGALTDLSQTEVQDTNDSALPSESAAVVNAALPSESAVIVTETPSTIALQNTERPEPEPVDSSECTWIQNTQIRVCVGDLTKEVVDAILITNKDNLDLTKGGQLNKHINLAAGPSVKKQCKLIINENGTQLPGNAVMTSAGNLPCKKIVHVIAYPGPPQILDLQLGVKYGLQLADERGMSSIALPTLGAGCMGLTLSHSAQVISGGILSFLERRPRNLREIKIVLFDDSLFSTFAQEVKNDFAPIKALQEYSLLSTERLDEDCIPQVANRNSGINGGRANNPPVNTSAEFRVYGKDRRTVTSAVNSLRNVFAKHLTVQRVTHKLAPRLFESSWAWLCEVASKHQTDIKNEAHNNTIMVAGNSDDVTSVVGCIWQEISRLSENQNNLEKRKLMSQYVRWHYIILENEIALTEKLSSTIEEACRQEKEGVTLIMDDHKYCVDFKSMTVKELCCSKYPPLRLSRKILADAGFFMPASWSSQPCFPDGTLHPVALVPVKISDEVEYKTVANLFYNTGGYGDIVSIERVQNLCLYKQYMAYKQEVELNNNRHGNNRNELQLFHGTSRSNLNSINRQGFNRTFSGKAHGAMYGNGVYFASRASYSMGYTVPDIHGLRHMYLARVVVGFYTQGHKGLLVPPPLFAQSPEVLFDSVVDSTSNPNVYVVFRDSQCYPEYLITLKT